MSKNRFFQNFEKWIFSSEDQAKIKEISKQTIISNQKFPARDRKLNGRSGKGSASLRLGKKGKRMD